MSTSPPDFEIGDSTSKLQRELSERTPAGVEAQVMGITADSSVEELAAALDASDWLLGRAKLIDRLVRQIAINWIDRNGEFDIGPLHYSVGYTSTVKCLDVPQTGHAVLRASGGDLEQIFAVMVAQPFKHGSVRACIEPAMYQRLFRSQRVGRLVDGVAERVLKRIDPTFTHARARGQ